MGKSVTITAKAPTEAAIARHAASAYRALAALEPTPVKVARAAQTVGQLRRDGLSVRGVVAALSVAGKGTLPAGKGTVERMGYVADAIAGEWPDVGDSGPAIAHVLYRIAQTGTAADVARAAEMGRKSTDADSAYAAVSAIRDELNAAQHRALTTPAARGVAGNAANGGNAADDNTDEGEAKASGSTRTDADDSASLGAFTLTALMREVGRRVNVAQFTPDAVLIGYADAIAEAFAEAAAREGADVDA